MFEIVDHEATIVSKGEKDDKREGLELEERTLEVIPDPIGHSAIYQ